MDTKVTFITDKQLSKKESPLNMESDVTNNSDLSDLFGKGKDLGFDDEPEDIPLDNIDINIII